VAWIKRARKRLIGAEGLPLDQYKEEEKARK
jgi:hypothetical protein